MELLHHGGRLRQAASQYGIAESDWLDLSTGVSPWHYPIPAIPASAWNRLPEDDDGLMTVARRYYLGANLNGTQLDSLAVAGSQAVIQALPQVLSAITSTIARPDVQACVLLPDVGYKEHERAWRKANWHIEYYHNTPTMAQIERCKVLLVINPNNPTGQLHSPAELEQWLTLVAANGGTLVIDEAFLDATPEHSLLPVCPVELTESLVVLRSIGKFYGLAGIRAGFVFANKTVITGLQDTLGPWCMNGPAREICKLALADIQWQDMQRQRLQQMSACLVEILTHCFSSVEYTLEGTLLFQTVYVENAIARYEELCRQGVLVRLTDEQDGLRFGLPANNRECSRLRLALTQPQT
ncbi:threonine-phosphate decarboxylase CobD [Shewanella benthica]|uniref:threonine-phosphate decarboxylase n=1 Tax=Shewanella benthica KT99 TaxID=314608 RepID=A9D3D3_9GAMM|nr:threonine-phosphate decarboxylase CobD [Shewanella benthica]EDQ01665.1 cobalamin biosynthetic protein CobC [Shewanella benthica KT99]